MTDGRVRRAYLADQRENIAYGLLVRYPDAWRIEPTYSGEPLPVPSPLPAPSYDYRRPFYRYRF